MKKILLLAVSALMLSSCSKSGSNDATPATVKDNSKVYLSEITYNGSPLMAFKYNNGQITEATNTYYKDVIAYKANGQIDTVVNYFNGTLNRIKRVTYGSNNKVATVNCYYNKTLQETTAYTYDSFNRISSITIVNGASNYLYTYGYNSSGNQTSYREAYTFNKNAIYSKDITTTSFDDKANPFLTLPNFEYFFSNTYQSEYNRLGVPATLGKNNIIQATGKTIDGTRTDVGAITYGLKYDVNDHVSQMKYDNLVGGSLDVTYGFNFIKQ